MGQHNYEFFGPHGPALLVIVLPLVCYGLVYTCNSHGCLDLSTLSVPGFPENMILFKVESLIAYIAWFALIVLLHLILPAKREQGVLLPNGARLSYRLNAFSVFATVYCGALFLGITGLVDFRWVYDNYLSLLTASIIFSTLLSFYLYFSSFRKGLLLSQHGNTGYPAYDFWMGRELNPRVGPVDLKEFCELYPGLILWTVLNLSMAFKQQQDLGYVTTSMLLVNAFQLYYVVDALWCEKAILTTMDITTDGFGFMLSFGDLSWVPFVFSTASRYLADYPQHLPWWATALILATKLLGYTIFRGANGQKDQFRRDPNDPSVRHLKTLKTQRGTQLIISGWWGTARHINYFGDWIMGVAWCMPCGLQGLAAVVPYFYCIYFASLLVHRERRDEAACRLKYGKDWDKYCKLVPWRIIPYVY